jgi:hypothetical protein
MEFYQFNEAASRYSVEINYRTTFDEVVDNWAKLVLGYVSAALKNEDYSVKRVFEDHEKPYRIIVSSNKNGSGFADGEWVGVITHNAKEGCFFVSKGFYRKETKNVVVTQTKKCDMKSASEIFKDFKTFMTKLKKEPPRSQKLKPVKGQTGPSQGTMRAAQGLMNKNRPDVINNRPDDPESKMGV